MRMRPIFVQIFEKLQKIFNNDPIPSHRRLRSSCRDQHIDIV